MAQGLCSPAFQKCPNQTKHAEIEKLLSAMEPAHRKGADGGVAGGKAKTLKLSIFSTDAVHVYSAKNTPTRLSVTSPWPSLYPYDGANLLPGGVSPSPRRLTPGRRFFKQSFLPLSHAWGRTVEHRSNRRGVEALQGRMVTGSGGSLVKARESSPENRKGNGGRDLGEVESLKKPFSPPREVHVQVTHSMPPEKIEIFKNLEGWVEENILVHLKPVGKCWQPQDFLPDPASDGFHDQVMELRERAKEIPDDYFVVLVGDMITEEALPTYQTLLNTADGVRDETAASLTSWAEWIRGWTAEENRHGDLLNKYLYLCGRVDMRQIEKTIQYLIGSGMDPRTENSPYLGFIYTSFQERATFISHGNTARHAKEYGDSKLAQICGTIASDEKCHEIAYTKVIEKLFEIDPDGTVLALADMMRKKIAMPAHLMYHSSDDNLFKHFSSVAQRLGVYTAKDYADILEFLVGRWKVEEITGLSSEGRKAQDYVCGLPQRIRRLEDRSQGKAKEAQYVPFSWIFDKQVKL